MRIIDIAFHGIDQLESELIESTRSSDATLVVDADEPALDVVSKASATEASLVLVVDSSGVVVGVVAPSFVVEQVNRIERAAVTDLKSAIAHLMDHPKDIDVYGHEWLNHARPTLFTCSGGPHYVDTCPCRYHPGNRCR